MNAVESVTEQTDDSLSMIDSLDRLEVFVDVNTNEIRSCIC